MPSPPWARSSSRCPSWSSWSTWRRRRAPARPRRPTRGMRGRSSGPSPRPRPSTTSRPSLPCTTAMTSGSPSTATATGLPRARPPRGARRSEIDPHAAALLLAPPARRRHRLHDLGPAHQHVPGHPRRPPHSLLHGQVHARVSPARGGRASLMAEAHAVAHDDPNIGVTGLDHRKLGMWAFLGSECMFFGSLIGTYLSYKGKSINGPGPHEILNIPLTSVSAFVLLMSSL